MSITEEEIKDLRNFKKAINSDDIRYKEKIKEVLLNNDKIIFVLNNKELMEAEAPNDEYFNVNILPYYMVTPTQTNVQNFICYEVLFDEEARYNDSIRYCQIAFYILCEQKNIIEQNTYIARHDLLAALLMDEFNYSNYFDTQFHCVSDKPSVVDNTYASRTLIFEGQVSNGIVRNGAYINYQVKK